MTEYRTEKDRFGEVNIPKDCYWGINTHRARDFFNVSNKSMPKILITSYAQIKLACTKINQKLGYINDDIGNKIQAACNEMIEGKFNEFVVIDPFQGGAGTSTNLNICEVIANRVLELSGKEKGNYTYCDPFEHINKHQSTNDTYPTAIKISIYKLLLNLEKEITFLQEEIQSKEREFIDIIKIGRTELMDAVPITLGREFSAWAEALSRDRWRIFKCTERIRVVNLGGTAIGTGIGAPREYIFQIVEELRAITGLPLSRAENLVDATQNQDPFLEVMGMIKTHAINLLKISNDLRLLNMGPDSGIAEIRLPELQPGSSIMPNKVNPIIPEMLAQVAIQVAAFDQAVTWAVGSGQLELNSFLPLIAYNVLESMQMLISANHLAATKCIHGITPNIEKCKDNVVRNQGIATVLVPIIGYRKATMVAQLMREKQVSFFEAAFQISGISKNECDKLISPAAVNGIGFVDTKT